MCKSQGIGKEGSNLACRFGFLQEVNIPDICTHVVHSLYQCTVGRWTVQMYLKQSQNQLMK